MVQQRCCKDHAHVQVSWLVSTTGATGQRLPRPCPCLTCVCSFFRASLPSFRAVNILVCCLVTSMLDSCKHGQHRVTC